MQDFFYTLTKPLNLNHINDSIDILRSGKNDYATIEVASDGIMYVDLHEEQEIGLAQAKAIFELSLDVGEGLPFPNLIRMNKLVLPTNEAREFMASADRASRAKAEAFVLSSLPQKIIGNFYLRFNKPPVPSKLFTVEADARQWLLHYVD